MNIGVSQYKSIGLETSVSSASPHRLIQMLYEGLLQSLTAAKFAKENKSHLQLSQHLKKASNILVGLEEALDFEKGGEIATNLQSLYQYIQFQLPSAQNHNDDEKLQHLIYLATQLKDAWDEINPESGEKNTQEAQIEADN